MCFCTSRTCRSRSLQVKDRQWHAPTALTRDDPIGARFDRSGDAVFAPRRDPFNFMMNGIERLSADCVEADKKLFHRAKDDRCFRTPAIGIAVVKVLLGQEHGVLAKDSYDFCFGV